MKCGVDLAYRYAMGEVWESFFSGWDRDGCVGNDEVVS